MRIVNLIILSIAVMLFFVLEASAQQPTKPFYGGLIGGLTANQIQGDGVGGFDKAGLRGGAFSAFELNEKWDFRFELTYVQKGSRKPPRPRQNDFSEFGINTDYVEAPLIFVRKLGLWQFHTGLSFGILTRHTEFDQFGPRVNALEIRSYELGYALGAGRHIKGRFWGEGRVMHSLLPVSRTAIVPQRIAIFGVSHLNVYLSVQMLLGEISSIRKYNAE